MVSSAVVARTFLAAGAAQAARLPTAGVVDHGQRLPEHSLRLRRTALYLLEHPASRSHQHTRAPPGRYARRSRPPAGPAGPR